MMDRPRSDPSASSALGKLAGFVIAVVVLAGIYVGYQALQVLFPPNTYETALLATVADTVDADGVLLFDEAYVPGGGTLGYLAADGKRVSAGAAVAEIYSSPEQAGLRQQLTSLNDQIELLQRSQNTTATQLDSLKKERASALYDMMDALDGSAYDETAQGEENYILAQNKLWVITGEVSDFSAQIASLTEQSAQVQAQLGERSEITAPQTGYFIRSSAAGRLIAVGSPDSAPIKRLIQETRDGGMLIDATYGRKTASVLIMDSDHVVLSALPAEKLAPRLGVRLEDLTEEEA